MNSASKIIVGSCWLLLASVVQAQSVTVIHQVNGRQVDIQDNGTPLYSTSGSGVVMWPQTSRTTVIVPAPRQRHWTQDTYRDNDDDRRRFDRIHYDVYGRRDDERPPQTIIVIPASRYDRSASTSTTTHPLYWEHYQQYRYAEPDNNRDATRIIVVPQRKSRR